MDNRLSRALIGIPLLASIALLSPASANVPPRCSSEVRAAEAARALPSQLDYVVLASLADSSSLLALSYNLRAPNK